MKKQLPILLAGALLALPAATNAQCTATISASAGCVPTTLTVNASFPVQSIIWQLNGVTIQSDTATWNQFGITVAGGNGSGSNDNEIGEAWFGNVDASGNVYVADNTNNRVQKWTPGATVGITVAGGNGIGTADNQLAGTRGCFATNDGTVYAGDEGNNRVMKWAPGATSGVLVAGGNGQGSDANQLNTNYGVILDDTGNIYIGDFPNNRIQKWAPGAITGTTVAGGNGSGNAANQLNQPYTCFVDDTGNVYVADVINDRIQKWAPGAIEGVTVAGGNGFGSALNKTTFPTYAYVDKLGNVYVADGYNNRLDLWTPGATVGVLVGGVGGYGTASNQLSQPNGIWLDSLANMYVADAGNYRVQEYLVGITDTLAATASGTYTAIIAGFNGCRDTVTYTPSLGSITPAGPTTFCAGGSVNLASSTGTGYTYQWLLNGADISGATASSYMASASGTYAVVLSNTNCTDTTTTVAVIANPLPVPVITANGNVLSATTGFTTYQWNLGNQPISGATTSTYTSTQNGHYTVTVTDANGCSGTSVILPLAVGNINGNTAISIYPNPTSSMVYINAPLYTHVSVSSVDGREVIQKDNATQVDMSQFADGVYIIKLTTAEGQLLKIEKVIKSSGN